MNSVTGLLLVVGLLVIAVGVGLVWRARRQRRALGIPAGDVVYQDITEHPGELLTSAAHRLRGRPDFLLDIDGALIPVEAKTGATPTYPYHGHIMQVIAYCVLVEAATGTRPPYGVIRYPEAQFAVDFTPELEARLIDLLAAMQRDRRAPTVHRQHTRSSRCEACGYRAVCDERLDVQLRLFDL